MISIWSRTITLNAVIGGNSANATMTGKYIQPPDGSPATGVPLEKCSVQPGTSKLATRSPTRLNHGRKNEKMSYSESQLS